MLGNTFDYYVFYKPYGVLSQFTQEVSGQQTLADYLDVLDDVYPVGRLDKDSEGLLLLSNDKSLTQQLLHPDQHYQKTYLVQVDGAITDEAIEQLRQGVDIRIKKKMYRTRPAVINRSENPDWLPKRDPPIRYRANIPTSWIEIRLNEGKNRQIRRMCAAVEFPVLRLIRIAIGNISLEGLSIGAYQKIDKSMII